MDPLIFIRVTGQFRVGLKFDLSIIEVYWNDWIEQVLVYVDIQAQMVQSSIFSWGMPGSVKYIKSTHACAHMSYTWNHKSSLQICYIFHFLLSQCCIFVHGYGLILSPNLILWLPSSTYFFLFSRQQQTKLTFSKNSILVNLEVQMIIFSSLKESLWIKASHYLIKTQF